MNQFLEKPSSDFQRIRDGRASLPLYIDIDLSVARSIAANTQLVLAIAGNSFYIDADLVSGGTAVAHFQDTNLGASSAPFTVAPGFIAAVGFTQILIENTAQAGKKLRVFYGVDVDFHAGSNATSSVTNSTEVRKPFTNSQKTVTNASTQLLAANPTRDYLLIQNNDPAGIIYISFGVAATLLNSVKINPGGSYEISQTVSTDAIFAIGSLATQSNVVTVEA